MKKRYIGIGTGNPVGMPMRIFLLLVFYIPSMNASSQLKPIASGVFRWSDLPVIKADQRESRKIAEGSTAEFEYFEIHATTQQKGAIPRPPHTQKDIEELIIVKEGTVKCTIGNKTAIVRQGGVMLIPPGESQTFENIGDGPLTYYVFLFRSAKAMQPERGAALLLQQDSLNYTEDNSKGTRKYFDRPTAMCANFEMHITYLKEKGPSHKAHTHIDTEMILVIDGVTEMTIDGKTYQAGAGDLLLAESGKTHMISNASDKPCSYFAFKWR